jgi:uncharacterized protein (TIRG00374 family)
MSSVRVVPASEPSTAEQVAPGEVDPAPVRVVESANGRRAPHLGGWVASLLTAGCVVFLFANTNLDEFGRAIQQADYLQLSVALGVSTLIVVAKGLRWCALYPGWARPNVGLAIAGVAAGQVANWAAPFRAGEVLRVGLVSTHVAGDRGRSLAAGIGVLVVEKLLDAGLLLVTVSGMVLLIGVPDWLSRTALVMALLACVVGLGVALRFRELRLIEWGPIGRTWLARWLPSRMTWLVEDANALGEGLSAWLTLRLSVEALVWSLLAWSLGGLTNYMVFRSVDVDPKQMLAATLAILAALYGAAVVPTLPGRLGVFQYVCVVTLAPFGVALEQALVFSLALYVVVYVPPMLIGVASMLFSGPAAWKRPIAHPDR